MRVYYPSLTDDSTAYAALAPQLDPSLELLVGATMPPDFAVLVEGRPSREQLTASPALQTLLIPWAGIPAPTRDLMRDFPSIAVHNLHHNAVVTAEMVLALLLAAAKFIVPVDRAFREHDWTVRYSANPSVVLAGKTALILGYGAIGRKVATLCKAFDMQVIATRRNPLNVEEGAADEVYPASALEVLLPRADVLIVCLPLTPETEGLLGDAELALLPRYALVVNVGRGAIIDEGALYHALSTGKIYGAGLDVWYTYPPDEASRHMTPPSVYPFHELDNVVLSPHRAGGSLETETRRMADVARLLNTVARGEPMPNRVDLERGY